MRIPARASGEGALTRKAYGTVSGTETLVSGIWNAFGAPLRPVGGSVPHWYRRYVSFTSELVTVFRRQQNPGSQSAAAVGINKHWPMTSSPTRSAQSWRALAECHC